MSVSNNDIIIIICIFKKIFIDTFPFFIGLWSTLSRDTHSTHTHTLKSTHESLLRMLNLLLLTKKTAGPFKLNPFYIAHSFNKISRNANIMKMYFFYFMKYDFKGHKRSHFYLKIHFLLDIFLFKICSYVDRGCMIFVLVFPSI